MKTLFLIATILTSSLFAYAQEIGVHFEQEMNWEQILVKAKRDNKNIFVDCYTTWCGPCKEMDKLTYPDEKLGNYFSDKFISVRLQMDTSKVDNDQVKKWYATAHKIDREYNVGAYPSFLFFSPDGKMVDRFLGYLSPGDLINIGKEALDTNRQYITLLDKYNSHSLDYPLMPYLAIKADLMGNKSVSYAVAQDYMSNYLFTLQEEEQLTPENLVFMERFTKSPNDRSFPLFKKNLKSIDSILGIGRAGKMLIRVIIGGELIPSLSGRQPNSAEWQVLERKYNEKYGNFGKMAVLHQRLFSDWTISKDWEDFGKAYILYFQNIGNLNSMHINNASWDVFIHVTDPKTISFAIQLMASHKDDDFESMDTYACLLYKAGRIEEAISLEKKIADIEEVHANNQHREVDRTYLINITKMKEGKKIWLSE